MMDDEDDSPDVWGGSLRALRAVEESLRCGICGDLFEGPVSLVKCAHAYCSLCIRQALNFRQDCPTCREEATHGDLLPNRALGATVDAFRAARANLLAVSRAHEAALAVERSDKAVGVGEAAGEVEDEEAPGRGVRRSRRRSLASEGVQEEGQGRGSVAGRVSRRRGKSAAGAPPKGAVVIDVGGTCSSEDEDVGREEDEDEDDGGERGSDREYVVDDEVEETPPDKRRRKQKGRADEGAGGGRSRVRRRDSGTGGHPGSGEYIECPVCGMQVNAKFINEHVDTCMAKAAAEEERAERQRSAEAARARKAAVAEREAETAWKTGGEVPPMFQRALGVDLVRADKHMPSLHYQSLKLAKLRQECEKVGLKTKGVPRETLERLHKDFKTRYNSMVDSGKSFNDRRLAAQVEREHARKGAGVGNGGGGGGGGVGGGAKPTSGGGAAHNDEQFAELIKQVEARKREAKAKQAAEAVPDDNHDVQMHMDMGADVDDAHGEEKRVDPPMSPRTPPTGRTKSGSQAPSISPEVGWAPSPMDDSQGRGASQPSSGGRSARRSLALTPPKSLSIYAHSDEDDYQTGALRAGSHSDNDFEPMWPEDAEG